MREVDFMAQLLALEEPWKVDQLFLAPKEKHLDVTLEHRPGASFACAECGRARPVYDHLPSRGWRHLDHGEFLTWIHARVPRVTCPEHGIRQVQVPWALAGARFTLPFERHAIDADGEVVQRTLCLGTPVAVGGHLDFAHAVGFGAPATLSRLGCGH